MKLVVRLIGLVALGLTVIPAALFAAGQIEEASMKTSMIVGTVLWFAAAPLWLKGGE